MGCQWQRMMGTESIVEAAWKMLKDWEGPPSQPAQGLCLKRLAFGFHVPMNHATSSRKLPEADAGAATMWLLNLGALFIPSPQLLMRLAKEISGKMTGAGCKLDSSK